MFKKLTALLVLSALLLVSGAFTFASNEEAIIGSITPKVLNVSISTDGEIDWGLMDLGQVKDTMTLIDTQTITNIGSVSFTISLKVSDSIPSNWQYINAIPSLTNEFSQEWALNSSGWTFFNADNSYLASGMTLDPSTSVSMDLRFYMPVVLSSGVAPQTFLTSVLAVAL
ncbi:MAG: hypothetical protein KJI70_00685 [Patescibacteria group bacterium]|nr:hypothetical protein [Patescibacteria group bacterium]